MRPLPPVDVLSQVELGQVLQEAERGRDRVQVIVVQTEDFQRLAQEGREVQQAPCEGTAEGEAGVIRGSAAPGTTPVPPAGGPDSAQGDDGRASALGGSACGSTHGRPPSVTGRHGKVPGAADLETRADV